MTAYSFNRDSRAFLDLQDRVSVEERQPTSQETDELWLVVGECSEEREAYRLTSRQWEVDLSPSAREYCLGRINSGVAYQ